MLEFIDIDKSFSGQMVLDGVCLTCAPGEILFVIGTSGAGKSVLIKQVVGLLRPDAGRILLDGQDITQLSERKYMGVRKKCALVFQSSTLLDSMTCQKNVELPLRMHPDEQLGRFRTPAEVADRARQLLDRVEMGAFAHKLPAELGDGLQKRVAIARALALRPRYVLFDEPTTSLDPESARRIDRLIVDLAVRDNVGCIVVSHDLRSIFSIAHKIAMLYKGKVKAWGTPDEVKKHPDPVVAQFVQGLSEGPLVTT